MRTVTLILATLGLMSNLAWATPENPVEGAEYRTLSNPQPVSSVGKKIEVLEFFMYHCPACNMLEPELLAWVKKQGNNVEFKRIHVPHAGPKDAEAHLFLTLEAMQIEPAMHAKVLQTWHVEHQQLLTDDDNLIWAQKNGLDKAKFTGFYNSFSVISKLQNLASIAHTYQVESTPTIIVDGRYLSSMSMVDASNPGLAHINTSSLQVLDALVLKAQAGK